MTPSFMMNHLKNCILLHPEHRRDFSLIKSTKTIKPSNLSDLCFCQFANPVILPGWKPTLLHAISCVRKACSKPQVIRIDTSRIVSIWTIVTNKNPLRNRSVVQNPRSSIAQYGTVSKPFAYEPVSSMVFTTGPQPAQSGFIYFRPKSIWKVWGQSLRNKVFGSNLDLHKSVRLICATLSAAQTARGQFHFI